MGAILRTDPRGRKKKNDSKRKPSIGLTPQEELFCIEYVGCSNATTAAKNAGYSVKTASSQGCKLLQKEKIKKKIDILKKNLLKASGITALNILLELKKVAFQNPNDLFEDWSKVKDFANIPAEVKAGIKDIKITQKSYGEVSEQFIQFQMHDKLKALEMIIKMLGLNEPEKNLNINENNNFNIPLIEWVEDEKQD